MQLEKHMKDLPKDVDPVQLLKDEISALKNTIDAIKSQPGTIHIVTEKIPPMQKHTVRTELVVLDGDIVQYKAYTELLKALEEAYVNMLQNRQAKLREVLGVTDALRPVK